MSQVSGDFRAAKKKSKEELIIVNG